MSGASNAYTFVTTTLAYYQYNRPLTYLPQGLQLESVISHKYSIVLKQINSESYNYEVFLKNK